MQLRKSAETVTRRQIQIPPGKRTHKVLAAIIATGFAGAAFLAAPSLALAADDEVLPPAEHTEEVVDEATLDVSGDDVVTEELADPQPIIAATPPADGAAPSDSDAAPAAEEPLAKEPAPADEQLQEATGDDATPAVDADATEETASQQEMGRPGCLASMTRTRRCGSIMSAPTCSPTSLRPTRQ